MTDTFTTTPDQTRETPQPAAWGGTPPGAPAWGSAVPPQEVPAWAATPPADPWQAPPTPPADPWRAPPPAPPARRRTDWRDWGRVGVASLASAVLAAAATVALTADDGAQVAESAPAAEVEPAAQVLTDYAAVAAEVRDSVVAISVASRTGEGAGSGVILDDAGNVLTNNHVIAGARTIEVTLADGRIFAAEVVGADESTDLAVVRIADAPDDLVAAELGTSATLQVGQQVMAVGNPLGLSSTVTTGIISALDRPVTTTDSAQDPSGASSTVVVTNAIQVDAAINPGNSGGPVFDLAGRVIGIASSIATLSGDTGSIGLGFAIPVDLASRVAAELIEDGTASHAFLGVSMSDTEVAVDGTARTGALVRQVVPGSAAAEAGLEVGDVVVAIGGRPVSGSESLTGYVRQSTPGAQVELEVARGGTTEAVTVTLGTSQ